MCLLELVSFHAAAFLHSGPIRRINVRAGGRAEVRVCSDLRDFALVYGYVRCDSSDADDAGILPCVLFLIIMLMT